LRPTVIKIDRDIVTGIARDDAKQALVEAFVSFGRRIGARLLAEGLEKRTDLARIRELGVDFGQGYLLGRPAPEPDTPRSIEALLVDPTTRTRSSLGGHVRRAAGASATSGQTRHLRTLPSD
jgi:EAL domain-containing protein (putative c-di-GMP-specific phosphodiesterase class I)